MRRAAAAAKGRRGRAGPRPPLGCPLPPSASALGDFGAHGGRPRIGPRRLGSCRLAAALGYSKGVYS